ncbi:MAG TPA: hypothetical protein VFW07_18275 [Parafilimonas sp.]|nr:hypothetical protein [Parafilimonas sp.]
MLLLFSILHNIVMKANSEHPEEINFSRDEIDEEIQKILKHPSFASSKILKRFLLFIIDQTLLGQANQLKEYTIAVSVLNKPKDFKPQINGVVRVHAGNLRRALNNYYINKGTSDFVRIFIPKGTYIPQFTYGITETTRRKNDDWVSTKTQTIIGVAPFTHLDNSFINCFADGLCTQLSSDLANIKNFSTIAYPVMRNLFERANWKLTSLTGIQHLIAGNIQLIQDQLRINVQLIETNTNIQVWNRVYERKINDTNMFKLQDEIVNLVIAQIQEFYNSVHNSIAVVA